MPTPHLSASIAHGNRLATDGSHGWWRMLLTRSEAPPPLAGATASTGEGGTRERTAETDSSVSAEIWLAMRVNWQVFTSKHSPHWSPHRIKKETHAFSTPSFGASWHRKAPAARKWVDQRRHRLKPRLQGQSRRATGRK